MRTLVIGIGNASYGDDGIGICILEEMAKYSPPSHTTLISIGTDPFSLFNEDLAKYERIIIVDGIISGGQTGDLYFIPASDLAPEPPPYSIHDLTWYEILRMGGFLTKTYLFAIEIGTLNTSMEISPILKEKLDHYTGKLYEMIVV